MDAQKIAKQGKILNIVIIVTTLIMFIFYNLTGTVSSGGVSSTTSTIMLAETIVLWIYRIIAAVCLALSIILIARSEKKVKGLGFLVASAAISLVFAILGAMLGILVWIFSGISIKKLSETASETSFKDRLNTPDDQTTPNNTL